MAYESERVLRLLYTRNQIRVFFSFGLSKNRVTYSFLMKTIVTKLAINLTVKSLEKVG